MAACYVPMNMLAKREQMEDAWHHKCGCRDQVMQAEGLGRLPAVKHGFWRKQELRQTCTSRHMPCKACAQTLYAGCACCSLVKLYGPSACQASREVFMPQ